MDSETVNVEERLKSLIAQVSTEFGILDRIVYKGKNQHRRSLYFQYLLKVRRDVRLLLSAKLEEILEFFFEVINGIKNDQTVQLQVSLKKRKSQNEKYNFQERLLGVARLLSQMVEPMVLAATEISSLLARSFFMTFSITNLALLARLRVLVQQILLDIVSVYNLVSSLSQKEHSVKLNQEGIEVYREYYPSNKHFTTLECVWEKDKFVLIERDTEIKNQDRDCGMQIPLPAANIKYQSIEVLLGGDELDYNISSDYIEECVEPIELKRQKIGASTDEPIKSMEVAECHNIEVPEGSPAKKFDRDDTLAASPSPLASPRSPKRQTAPRTKVAFVSVKMPRAKTDESSIPKKLIGADLLATTSEEEDPFFRLLTGGNMKNDSIF